MIAGTSLSGIECQPELAGYTASMLTELKTLSVEHGYVVEANSGGPDLVHEREMVGGGGGDRVLHCWMWRGRYGKVMMWRGRYNES